MGVLAADTLQGPKIGWLELSPLLVLLGGAMVLLVVAALTPVWPKRWYATFSAAVALGSLGLCFPLWHRIDVDGPKLLVGNAMHFDHMSVWVIATISVAVFLASLVTDDYLRREGLDGPEIYALYMMAAIGGIVMGSANDLVVLFLGLEILSIALYVLAASHRKRIQSQESGLKYFVLGGVSSAIFLYGVALIYGGTGSTNFDRILSALSQSLPLTRPGDDAMLLAGVALLLVGLAFKVAAVPFHFWAPDVYEGAPTPVSGFMASAAKAAAFAAMLRVLLEALPNFSNDYRPVVWVLAAITILGGSMMAVVQTNVKRMLAFSSVSHAGFMLVGVEAASRTAGGVANDGRSSVLLYTMIYSVLALGTWGVVTAVGRTGDGATDLGAFRGLGRARPALAMGMTVLLLAQAGVPLTAGFIAKFGVIRAAVDADSNVLAVVAMAAAVIAAYLYLRIMISMWIAEPEAGDDAREQVRVPAYLNIGITLAVAFTLVVGFFPDWLVSLAP
ncbi:MAG: NADH-quinone oxidoreductase subunit N [Ilumatobacteraceae bacterium]